MLITRTRVLVLILCTASTLGMSACGDGGGTDLDLPAGVTLSADAKAGQALAQKVGCAACHSVDGSDGVGPSFAGVWGSEVELEDGGPVIFDRDYLIESVREPSAKRAKGAKGQMPEFGESRISDDELIQVEAYLQALAGAGS